MLPLSLRTYTKSGLRRSVAPGAYEWQAGDVVQSLVPGDPCLPRMMIMSLVRPGLSFES